MKSARICALCYKQCGTNIEAAHIVAEAGGGSNDDANAIPLCFDCHQEVGAYDVKHPKGNKFSVEELIARRDKLYSLVESGALQAQVVANQLHATKTVGALGGSPSPASAASYQPGAEVKAVLKHCLDEHADAALVPSKLKLLGAHDVAYVIDQLAASLSREAARALGRVIASGSLDQESVRLLLEQLLRRTTLMGTVDQKAAVLRLAAPEVLATADEGLRTAFFEDVISIMQQDQFAEVNLVTPAVVAAQAALPPSLEEQYVDALLSQGESNGYEAGPAAQEALKTLPEHLAMKVYQRLSKKELVMRHTHESLREFVAATQDLWPAGLAGPLKDFVGLSPFEFVSKYWKD